MKVLNQIKTGEFHKKAGLQCQDRCGCAENERYLAVTLADGVSACRFGGEGAEALCEALAKESVNEGDYLMEISEYRVAGIMETVMATILEAVVRNGYTLRDYSSTFLMVLLNKITGKMVLINLGDGAVEMVADQKMKTLLKPKKHHGQPCTSTTGGLAGSIQVEFRELKDSETIFLCTDGMLDWMKAMGEDAIQKILDKPQWYNVLNSEVGKAAEEDDCSYIMILQD